jgi:hypothetical protein
MTGTIMFLGAEQYQNIVSQLRSERAPRRSLERRNSPRVGLRVPVQVIPCRTGTRAIVQSAWLRDLSAGGVGLIFHQPLEIGSYLVVCFPRKNGPPLDVLFVVSRCVRLNTSHFSIGARFQRIITDALVD